MAGFLGKLLGSGAVDAVSGIANTINQFVETPDEKRAAEALIAKMAAEPAKAQAEINKIEAGHRTLFVAGWRPSIGWVCSISLGLYFIPQYALGAVLWFRLSWAAQEMLEYPIKPDALMELVLAMLGMGTIRMLEKMTGNAK